MAAVALRPVAITVTVIDLRDVMPRAVQLQDVLGPRRATNGRVGQRPGPEGHSQLLEPEQLPPLVISRRKSVRPAVRDLDRGGVTPRPHLPVVTDSTLVDAQRPPETSSKCRASHCLPPPATYHPQVAPAGHPVLLHPNLAGEQL